MIRNLMCAVVAALALAAPAGAAADEAVRAVFVTLGAPGKDAIGPYINAATLRASLAKLPTNNPVDVIVLRVNSAGGMLAEVPRLSDLMEELKGTSRVVVWVDRAISAAALTSVSATTIVMSPEGTIGSAVTFVQRAGRTEALAGADLEKALQVGEGVAKRGKHEPLLVRAMQVSEPLSCDLGAAGPVNWRQDETGTEIVNRSGEILTLTAEQAARYGLAAGIADSKDGLMKLIGYAEWTEVGAEVDADQARYRAEVQQADLDLQTKRMQKDEELQNVRTAATPEEKKMAMKRAAVKDAEIGQIFKKFPALREYYGAKASDEIVPPGSVRKVPVSEKPVTVPAGPAQR